MEQIITVDIGTTQTKTALVERSGKILASGLASYRVLPGNKEQDADDWWRAVQEGLAPLKPGIKKDRLCAIILGGQMQDMILIKGEQVLHPVILYSDTRAGEEIGELVAIISREVLKTVTGNIQDASSLLAKLLWLKKNEPGLYKGTESLLFGAHDYLAWKMCGSRNTDYTTASTTGLMNITENAWALELLDRAGLRRDWLPGLVRADNCDGRLAGEAASVLGLPEGTPVFHGAGDVGSTTIGAGAGEPGPTYCYLGTSGWVAASASGPGADPETGIYNLRHPAPSRLIQVGPMILAGGNLEWALNEVSAFNGDEEGYALLNEAASGAAPGCGGVIYLPYLAGERAPFKDPKARGCFIGLSRETKRAELCRAVLEGVALAMRSIREAIGGEIGNEKLLTLVGGGARSDLWPQIFADVFGSEVTVLQEAEDVGAIGSAVIYGRAMGWFSGYSLPDGFQKAARRYSPDERRRKRYERLYSIFKGIYPALKNSYAALANYRKMIETSG